MLAGKEGRFTGTSDVKMNRTNRWEKACEAYCWRLIEVNVSIVNHLLTSKRRVLTVSGDSSGSGALE